MTTLTREQIIDEVKPIKNGTYVRIGYRSELPVRAELKKQGYQAYKVVETTVRLGVNYGKIASVVARKSEKDGRKKISTSNYSWVIKNKVRYNKNTGKDYLYVANVNGKGANTKELYVLIPKKGKYEITCVKDIFEQEFKDVVIPSYWTKHNTCKEVQNIAFDNIYRVGNVGKDVKECNL